ncbi:MAG: hypothetical protein JW981_02090 [Anaerolineae bacterium]|nr:hypothetical protein [Anaerolineae bacterium]
MPAELGEPLSERELEIVELVTEGLTNREVATRLYLSPNTIKVHLRNIFSKTGVASRTELSMLAVKEGWIEVETSDEVSDEALTEGSQPQSQYVPVIRVTRERTLPPWPLHRTIALSIGLVIFIGLLFLSPVPESSATTGESSILIDNPNAALSAPASPLSEGWQELSPMPMRRDRFGATLLDGRIYVIGGITPEGTSGRLDIYDIEENRWTEGTPRPIAAANTGAVTLDDVIFVAGGCDAQQAIADSHRYTPEADEWEAIAPLPEPLCAYAMTVWDGKIYLFGGWNGKTYRAITYRYTPETDTWDLQPSPTRARAFGAAITLNNRLYYVGGYDNQEQATCEVYVAEENHWVMCPSMLLPRGGLGLTALGGQVYAIGGGWENYLGFNERYNPKTNSWSVVETPLVGEWRHLGVIATDTTVYTFGGWDGDYLNRTYSLEVLPFSIFVPSIPKE